MALMMSVQYTEGYSVHWGMSLSTLEDVMSTPGVVQYSGGYHEYTRGYHDECGDIMSTPGDV